MRILKAIFRQEHTGCVVLTVVVVSDIGDASDTSSDPGRLVI